MAEEYQSYSLNGSSLSQNFNFTEAKRHKKILYATGTCIIPHAVFDKHEHCFLIFLILFISLPEILPRYLPDDS